MFTSVNTPLFTFVHSMKIEQQYSRLFRAPLEGRYIHNEHILPLLETASDFAKIEVVGHSQNGLPIHSVTLGYGNKKVLAWSQMHGNESTTTKALFDFLQVFQQKEALQEEISAFLSQYTLVFIPILNPDGALAYTRVNANEVDLNRDALDLNEKEGRIHRKLLEEFKPDLCLNLHDQRTIYGTEEGKPTTVSFLSPAASPSREITAARQEAMRHIVRLHGALEQFIPGQLGRYDDTFNENCLGDYITKMGVPTILFEAGHYPGDYQREKTRELIFYAFLELFHFTHLGTDEPNYKDYFKIPENKVNFKDVIIRNVRISGYDEVVSVGIQYTEVLKNDKISFEPIVDAIGDLDRWYTHYENDGNKGFVLLNYQKKEGIGEKIVSIIEEFSGNTLFYSGN
ncbi:MAG: DUF2817 domain-containing protein [Flavobacterium sp.]|nr:MAG: DUF2817 domain-containing protein [Flavobacterium sp.]